MSYGISTKCILPNNGNILNDVIPADMDTRCFISLISGACFLEYTQFLKWKAHNGHLESTSWSLTAYYFGIYEYESVFESSL